MARGVLWDVAGAQLEFAHTAGDDGEVGVGKSAKEGVAAAADRSSFIFPESTANCCHAGDRL